jgi:hypothetical protein
VLSPVIYPTCVNLIHRDDDTSSSQVVHPLVHTVVLFHTATMLQPTRLSLDTPKEFRFRNGFSTRQGHRSSRTSLIVSCRKGAREGGGTRSGVSLPWHDLYTQVLGRRMLSCKGGTPHRLLITPLYHGSDHIRTNQPSIYRSRCGIVGRIPFWTGAEPTPHCLDLQVLSS